MAPKTKEDGHGCLCDDDLHAGGVRRAGGRCRVRSACARVRAAAARGRVGRCAAGGRARSGDRARCSCPAVGCRVRNTREACAVGSLRCGRVPQPALSGGVSLQPEAWRCLRVLAAVFGTCTAACVSLACGLFPSAAGIAFAAFGLAAGWLGPRAALWAAERNRRRAIEASLPDAMELLGIAVAAGSPLEQCFKEVAASVEGPLSEELSLVDQEVNLRARARESA